MTNIKHLSTQEGLEFMHLVETNQKFALIKRYCDLMDTLQGQKDKHSTHGVSSGDTKRDGGRQLVRNMPTDADNHLVETLSKEQLTRLIIGSLKHVSKDHALPFNLKLQTSFAKRLAGQIHGFITNHDGVPGYQGQEVGSLSKSGIPTKVENGIVAKRVSDSSLSISSLGEVEKDEHHNEMNSASHDSSSSLSTNNVVMKGGK